MAPMTRSRAIDANAPNALMFEYYGAWRDVPTRKMTVGGVEFA